MHDGDRNDIQYKTILICLDFDYTGNPLNQQNGVYYYRVTDIALNRKKRNGLIGQTGMCTPFCPFLHFLFKAHSVTKL